MKKLLSIAVVVMLTAGIAYAGDKNKSCCSKKTAKTECSKEAKEGEGKACCSKKTAKADEKATEKKACCAKKTQEATAE